MYPISIPTPQSTNTHLQEVADIVSTESFPVFQQTDDRSHFVGCGKGELEICLTSLIRGTFIAQKGCNY